MTAPDLAELRRLLEVDHTETDLEARARVLMRHLTGAEWDDMDPGTRSKVGTEMVRALHFADEIDPARQRLALVLAALPHLLELNAGVRALADVQAERSRQNAKWGEQNHPDGTGDDVALLGGQRLPQPFPHVAVTMGALAYTARNVTNRRAAEGRVTWADILLEEVGEAFAERDAVLLRAELVQVAAVATQWVEAIDRRALLVPAQPTAPADGATPTHTQES